MLGRLHLNNLRIIRSNIECQINQQNILDGDEGNDDEHGAFDDPTMLIITKRY